MWMGDIISSTLIAWLVFVLEQLMGWCHLSFTGNSLLISRRSDAIHIAACFVPIPFLCSLVARTCDWDVFNYPTWFTCSIIWGSFLVSISQLEWIEQGFRHLLSMNAINLVFLSTKVRIIVFLIHIAGMQMIFVKSTLRWLSCALQFCRRKQFFVHCLCSACVGAHCLWTFFL